MAGLTMKTDDEIKRDVEEELRLDPEVDDKYMAVDVNAGAVALTGFVSGYSDKFHAEQDAKRVAGVIAVANDIEVRVPSHGLRADPDIARDAVLALKIQMPKSARNIRVAVRDGAIVLEGEVEWNYQRERARDSVRWVRGVKSIVNALEIKATVDPTDIRQRIEAALKRHADIDATQLQVETNHTEVILKGIVHSWTEHTEAEQAAWRAPGVEAVVNFISVRR
jgi:osmotically-inducible protein OsmY